MISVRKHGGEDLGSITIEEFANMIDSEITKSIKPFK